MSERSERIIENGRSTHWCTNGDVNGTMTTVRVHQ